jgi:hypothetical protein
VIARSSRLAECDNRLAGDLELAQVNSPSCKERAQLASRVGQTSCGSPVTLRAELQALRELRAG